MAQRRAGSRSVVLPSLVRVLTILGSTPGELYFFLR